MNPCGIQSKLMALFHQFDEVFWSIISKPQSKEFTED